MTPDAGLQIPSGFDAMMIGRTCLSDGAHEPWWMKLTLSLYATELARPWAGGNPCLLMARGAELDGVMTGLTIEGSMSSFDTVHPQVVTGMNARHTIPRQVTRLALIFLMTRCAQCRFQPGDLAVPYCKIRIMLSMR